MMITLRKIFLTLNAVGLLIIVVILLPFMAVINPQGFSMWVINLVDRFNAENEYLKDK